MCWTDCCPWYGGIVDFPLNTVTCITYIRIYVKIKKDPVQVIGRDTTQGPTPGQASLIY